MVEFTPVTKGRNLPGRYVMYGPEGIGKTSFAAYAPKPLFIQTKGESGLETLINAGQLPETPHIPGEVQSWTDLLAVITWLVKTDQPYKTLVIDTLDGAEQLCFEHVIQTQYDGELDKFMAYHKGYDTSPRTWRQFLIALDKLRAAKKMSMLCLAHSKVLKKRNPEGEDWTAHAPNLHDKTWSVTKEWADAIFFSNFSLLVNKEGKASGGTIRTIYTQHTPTYDAKNRFGLPEQIDGGNAASEAWKNFIAAKTAANSKQKGK